MKKLAVAVALFGLPLVAQYPYPPNYPAGPYPPMGGADIPVPHHQSKRQKKKADQNQTIIAADGVTVSNDGKKLVVYVPDGRTLTMSVAPTTKFIQGGNEIAASKIVPRTKVHVEAAEDDDAYLTAVRVELLKDAEPEAAQRANTAAPAPETAPKAETLDDEPPEAPGAPILRRGRPKDPNLYASRTAEAKESGGGGASAQPVKNGSNGDFDFTIDAASTSKPVHTRYDDLIEQTRNWVATFTNGLPNYLCQQDTTRYIREAPEGDWEPQDVVTAEVVYQDGHEEYRNITVGGKKTNKSMMELGGQTSTGEFASMLFSLFHPARQTQFTFDRSGNIGDTEAAIYNFKVLLPRSDWTITVGGQSLRPAYSGAVWIDKKSAVVRRLEMRADNIPHDFPMDRVQTAVDYDLVALGGREFLLPVHSENMSCQRGTTLCAKNTIDFRNYHKFEGESTITFGK
jgi:hypothetical protein